MCKKNARMVCDITLKMLTYSTYIIYIISYEWKREVYTAAFIVANSNVGINIFYGFYKMLLSI
jgi:hypothetical protein